MVRSAPRTAAHRVTQKEVSPGLFQKVNGLVFFVLNRLGIGGDEMDSNTNRAAPMHRSVDNDQSDPITPQASRPTIDVKVV